jgi:ABC-type branched-subunit amino acid transport system ATPase component
MAVKKRWPISEEVKSRLVERLAMIAVDSPEDDTAIKAANVLRSMEQQNQKDEQTNNLQSDRNRFLEIAARLGIGKSVGGATRIGADSGAEIIDGSIGG